jgi:hypothetical protein
MNKKLEKKMYENVSLLGYKALVKAIMNCDEEVQNDILEEWNRVTSNSGSRPL